MISDDVVAACTPWSAILRTGQSLQIIDLHGNQAVDTLFYAVDGDRVNPTGRYSAQATIAAQRNIFLTTGTRLLSTEGRAMMTITADTCGNHDTSGGACSCESNALRYGHHTRHQHACVENFLLAIAPFGMGKRDMTSNINWFMNVPVEADGSLGIVDGLSAPGKYVDLRAEMRVLVVLANTPHVLDPRRDYHAGHVRLLAWRGEVTPADDAIRSSSPERLRAFESVEDLLA